MDNEVLQRYDFILCLIMWAGSVLATGIKFKSLAILINLSSLCIHKWKLFES